ncbi:MAG TPA: CYTH domain-containing protein [Acidimicrobiales bacterium]|nr:CYTH domain-containing protein [Acidimicrobiales bacterium]
MGTETERKFVVAQLPAGGVLGAGTRLRQGYLAASDGVEVRVRVGGGEAWLTVKVGTGLSRHEVEVPITLVDAEALWPATEGRRVEKVRHRVPVGGHVAEVDVYEGDLAGLRTVEVEFSSEDAARAFTPPAWFGDEVTGTPGWDNASLARHGRPG